MKHLIVLFVLFFSFASNAYSVKKIVILNIYDGTNLTAYLFKPSTSGMHSAVVLLHGRRGLYSTLAHGIYNESTLSKRHKLWSRFWTDRGYVVLFVDSFGSRGFPDGFYRGTHSERPPQVNERTVRPLDAYSGLSYLKNLSYVDKNKIGVMGWSNGGSTVLNTLSIENVGLTQNEFKSGFKAGLAFYPGCSTSALYMPSKDWIPYAPLQVFIAGDDDEVSPTICLKLFEKSSTHSDLVTWNIFEHATHNFDDPSPKNRLRGSNEASSFEAQELAEKFFKKYLN